MGLMQESLRALLQMTFPVAVLSCGLVWWAVRRGYIEGNGNARALEREIKALSNERKRIRKEKGKAKRGKTGDVDEPPVERRFDLVQEKWMKFGGGFYGVVALYTYLLVEGREIADFIANFGGFFEMLRRISIGAVIELLIKSIMNFVAAIAWPFYWLKDARSEYFWAWFVAAYLGYWLGIRIAQFIRQRSEA